MTKILDCIFELHDQLTSKNGVNTRRKQLFLKKLINSHNFLMNKFV